MHALSTDHSPLLISLLNGKPDKNDNDFCKFNNSLVNDVVYVEKMKNKKKKRREKSIIQTNLWKPLKQYGNFKKLNSKIHH